LTMDGNVALAGAAPCRASRIGAKLRVRIHGKPPELRAHGDFTEIRVYCHIVKVRPRSRLSADLPISGTPFSNAGNFF
jgi:hypothetical protein